MPADQGATSIAELSLTLQDLDIFRIPDRRTRVATLQNYFFPRLEVLLRHTLQLLPGKSAIDPVQACSFVYHPFPRDETESPRYIDEVYMGIAGRRRRDRFLQFERPDGKRLQFHPTYLFFEIGPKGYIQAVLLPFRYLVSLGTIESVARQFDEYDELVRRLLVASHVSYSDAARSSSFGNALLANASEPRCFTAFSPRHYFPVSENRGLQDVILGFSALYCLFESLFCFGEGIPHDFGESVEKTLAWLRDVWAKSPKATDLSQDPGELELPDLDSYRFIRAGLWWQVLARDRWTCQSCGRRPHDGVTLHVDHIIPRSMGGADLFENLQTLCSKCNLGKSNRDKTDLRW